MPLNTEVGLGLDYIVLDPSLIPKGEQHPQFSAHVYYGQMAGWMKMALGMEVAQAALC